MSSTFKNLIESLEESPYKIAANVLKKKSKHEWDRGNDSHSKIYDNFSKLLSSKDPIDHKKAALTFENIHHSTVRYAISDAVHRNSRGHDSWKFHDPNGRYSSYEHWKDS